MILLSLYVRYFGERLVTSIYPSTNINTFTIIILFLVWFILQKEIVVLARMNKIILVLVAIQFYLILLLLLSKVNLQFITPISTLDIVPAFKGCIGYVGIGVYLFYFSMISDKVIIEKDFKDFKRNMISSSIFSFLSITLLIVALLGTFGHQTLEKIPLPLLMAVKKHFRRWQFLRA